MDYGGAGVQAASYLNYTEQQGYFSRLLVLDKRTNNDNIIQYKKTLINKVNHNIAKWRIKQINTEFDYYFFNKYESVDIISAREILKQINFIPNYIFLHWISDFMNAKVIKDLYDLTKANLVWYMMDNAPLTGGCHYPWECKGYQTDCSNCPAITIPKFRFLAKKNLEIKKRFLPENILLVTGGTDYNRSKQSSLFKNKKIIRQIAPVDETVFYPIDKKIAKNYWGIRQEQRVIFVGASAFHEKRKGFHLLIEALKHIIIPNLVLVTAGNVKLPDIPVPYIQFPYLNENELVKMYQAADLFLCPSIEDSGPIMINQSIMCGTPVIAFSTGVAVDIVINGKTGYRAEKGDIKDFCFGINSLLGLKIEEYNSISANCREFGMKHFSSKTFKKMMHEILTTHRKQ